MENKSEDLEQRLALLEEKTQALTDLLAGLAKVTQQLMEMNTSVLEAARHVKSKQKQ